MPKGPIGNCYWNVDHMIGQMGGDMVLGWQILWWPERYVEALHHAVWRGPDDRLYDITDKYPSDHREFTTFAPDDTIPISLAAPVFVPSKWYPLRKSPAVNEVIAAGQEQIELKQAHMAEVVALGGVWTAGADYGISEPSEILVDLEAKMAANRTRVSHSFIACRDD